MKLTKILFAQHRGRMLRRHWLVQRERFLVESNAEKTVKVKGLPVVAPEDIVFERPPFEKIEVVQTIPKPLPLDNTHPHWHDQPCFSYKDHNVLTLAVDQAKVLTKTVSKDGLPYTQIPKLSKEINSKAQQIILASHVFDAEQVKLAIVKDPARPAWVFPRTYGISEKRVNYLMTSRLLQLCETLSDKETSRERYAIDDALMSFPFARSEGLFQFELAIDKLLTTSQPLSPVTNETSVDEVLPNLFPMKCNISLQEENIYQLRNLYPVNVKLAKSAPHTLFVFYNKSDVKNLYETPVTEEQILSRSIMNAFTASAAFARRKFGENVKDLPQPVTVQCVQTDGRLFHFGVYQLNTLDLEDGSVKNVWFSLPQIPLFTECCYKAGRPVLEGYNSEVVAHLLSFYSNRQ